MSTSRPISHRGRAVREDVTCRTGTAVDGVVAIDPVALSYLLEGTGPVEVVLTSDTVSRNRCRVRLWTQQERLTCGFRLICSTSHSPHCRVTLCEKQWDTGWLTIATNNTRCRRPTASPS